MSSASSPGAPRVESGSLSGRVKEGSYVLISDDSVPGNGIGYVKSIDKESATARVRAAGADHAVLLTNLLPFTALSVL